MPRAIAEFAVTLALSVLLTPQSAAQSVSPSEALRDGFRRSLRVYRPAAGDLPSSRREDWLLRFVAS